MEIQEEQKEFLFTRNIAIILCTRVLGVLPWDIHEQRICNAFNILGSDIQRLVPVEKSELNEFFRSFPHFYTSFPAGSEYYRGRNFILEVDKLGVITDLWPHTERLSEYIRYRDFTVSRHVVARFLERFHGIPEGRASSLAAMRYDLRVKHAYSAIEHVCKHGVILTNKEIRILSDRCMCMSRRYGVEYYHANGIVLIVNVRNRVVVTALNPLDISTL